MSCCQEGVLKHHVISGTLKMIIEHYIELQRLELSDNVHLIQGLFVSSELNPIPNGDMDASQHNKKKWSIIQGAWRKLGCFQFQNCKFYIFKHHCIHTCSLVRKVRKFSYTQDIHHIFDEEMRIFWHNGLQD